ncbi:MAG: flagellar export chaperone FliS [Actinomycetota bacterium]
MSTAAVWDRSAAHRYVGDLVATASPARLLVALYDRLLLDLDRAVEALRDPAPAMPAGPHLLHAQEVLLELRASLDVAGWSGGPGLAAVYAYLLRELVAANVTADAARVLACRDLVEPLADAWRRALGELGSGGRP